jgi:hypothetical protein
MEINDKGGEISRKDSMLQRGRNMAKEEDLKT